MSNFGALTDHFGLASTDLVLVDSSEIRIEQSRADALDENGDIAATTYYGNTSQSMREVSCTYALKSGSLNINTIKLGALASAPTVLRESISVTTSNSEWPQITVTGRKNIISITAPAGKLNTFTLPSLTLQGRKVAQSAFFNVVLGSRLIASSVDASVEVAQQDNGLGEPIAHGVSGGQGTFSGELVRTTAGAGSIATSPNWSVDTTNNTSFGITQTQAPGLEQGQAEYHTGTGTGAFTIIRDNAT
jgi:hypothetical protein